MEEILSFLNSICPLSEALQQRLAELVKSKELAKRDILLNEGQISRAIYFIKKGIVRCYYKKDDVEVTAWLMKEGEVVVSVESFYDQKPSYEVLHALEDVEVLYITHHELEELYANFPEFNTIGRVLTIKYLKFWNRQLFSLRMKSARERYNYLAVNEPDLMERVPSKYLASYLGMTEVTFCNMKK